MAELAAAANTAETHADCFLKNAPLLLPDLAAKPRQL